MPRRRLLSALRRWGFALGLVTTPVWAERDPAECIKDHANAQELADSGKLLEARQRFESCATSDCPKMIQADCAALGRAVENAIPTLSLTILDHHGRTPAEYRIAIDGVTLPPDAKRLSIAVDPGERRIKVTAPGYPDAQISVIARRKQKNQATIVQFAPPDPIANKVRTAGYVFAGISAAAILSFTGFAISGYTDQRRLESNASRADDSSLRLADRMHHKYAIADTSLGIGLVSLGAATFLLYVTRNSSAATASAPKTALHVRGMGDGGGVLLTREF